MKKIIIDIDGDGNTEYKTIGFKGKACMAFAKGWKEALKLFGVEHENESLESTDEMFATEEVTERATIRNSD